MRLIVIVLLTIIGLACARVITNNGRPGCKTQLELQIMSYRNFWDPTAYWVCERLGVAAREERCEEGNAWYDKQKRCVDWDSWEWEELVSPPSKP